MPSLRRLGIFIVLVSLGSNRASDAGERPLTIEFLAPKPPSVFPGLLWVKFVNLNYAHLDLGQLFAASEVEIDGHPATRVTAYGGGSMNLAPGSSWEGCMSFEDYQPHITPGRHEMTLKFGEAMSNRLTITWSVPRTTSTLTESEHYEDAKSMLRVIKPGLPRACVEMWFPVKDGGVQPENITRYYLGQNIKARVPYGSHSGPEQADDPVKGSVQLYREARMED